MASRDGSPARRHQRTASEESGMLGTALTVRFPHSMVLHVINQRRLDTLKLSDGK